MEQTTINEAPVTPQRPQFLTVLCILTFVGVGLGIIWSIIRWFSIRAMAAMMNGTSDLPGMEDMDMESMPGMETVMLQAQHINTTSIVGIVGCLICLLGALQMWKLKKIGFYIYVVGEIAPVIVSAVLMGASAFAGFAIILAVIAVLFVVLYALNLKHMH